LEDELEMELNDDIKEKAIALSDAIMGTEEYTDFLQKEEVLKGDSETQELLLEFQQKQQDFIAKQLSGEVDQDLLNQLTDLQSKLKARESLANFLESYTRLLDMLGEITDIISQRINVDIAEVFRQR
jgi:cell fate (sporulation/competence/biofilm development) regulator YlbF (YheA/YmcA/DUF963 family)